MAKVNDRIHLKPSEYQMDSRSYVPPADCCAIAPSIEAPEKENVVGPDPSVTEVRER